MSHESLTQLGSKVEAAANPDEAVLECVPIGEEMHYLTARFTCPEFTSLCPVTGQPDFAVIVIDYIPEDLLVESKSLKLYLHSFRNHRAFHEACIGHIASKIAVAAAPTWYRVTGLFNARGGIPLDVVVQSGPPPKHAHILPIDHLYRGQR